MPQTNQKQPVIVLNQAYKVILARVQALLQTQARVLLAIDGNCCAGKTTTATRLGGLLNANVFHLDDYFLQPHMRTPERLRQPGGNVDAERFLSEVLLPVSRGETAIVRRYDCHQDALLAPEAVLPRAVSIIEGAYSMHPLLASYYDLKLFCRIDPAQQQERILARNGEEMLPMFLNRWIPLENTYFAAYPIAQTCDFVIDSIQQ